MGATDFLCHYARATGRFLQDATSRGSELQEEEQPAVLCRREETTPGRTSHFCHTIPKTRRGRERWKNGPVSPLRSTYREFYCKAARHADVTYGAAFRFLHGHGFGGKTPTGSGTEHGVHRVHGKGVRRLGRIGSRRRLFSPWPTGPGILLDVNHDSVETRMFA